jgi:recombinational DNA repair protein (RecF pathway)
VQLYRDDGIVLRTQKLGEADRIITILGRTSGRIRAVAKGVRRTKSRFGARLEPFTHVDLMLHTGRSLDIITQAEVIRPYGQPLPGDYPRYTSGVAMLETAERFTPVEKEPAPAAAPDRRAARPRRRGARSRPRPRRLPAALARGGGLRPRPARVRPLRCT